MLFGSKMFQGKQEFVSIKGDVLAGLGGYFPGPISHYFSHPPLKELVLPSAVIRSDLFLCQILEICCGGGREATVHESVCA